MKILITGAAGFIGTNLSEHLLEQGHNVFGVDNFITGRRENHQNLRKHQNFDFLEADIVDLTKDQKAEMLKIGFDQIYHLACPTGVPNLVTLAEEMLATCSLGTRNILEIARLAGSKILFTSSSEIYGDPMVSPQTETYTGNVDSTGLRSPYEEGKRFSESLVMMQTRKFGVDSRIVRVFNTYGPAMNDSDERVIPRFIRQIRDGKEVTIHGAGIQKRTFCHVQDLISGLVLIMEKGGKGSVYNLGGDRQITILELAALLGKILGQKLSLRFTERPGHDHEFRLPDLAKMFDLGWSQQIALEEGLSSVLRLQQSAKI